MILNGSPRAPKSNSKRYAEIFSKYSELETDTFMVKKTTIRNCVQKWTDIPMSCLSFRFMPILCP